MGDFWGHGWGHGWGHAWWMGFWWLIVASGIGWAIWTVTRSGRDRDHRESAEEALRRRYAAGEIDEDEYRKRLSVLQQTRR